ncbi:MAG: polysaccharide pyruvyl transferase family protein [Paludibacteraceae bacterium]|nr:polysaccharide pyruvyl transferase family protein [Paludibacteraceae bacterium]
MKRINIVGWYGTETIGDRAILAGLVSLFSLVVDEFEIILGSLCPSFSQRTVLEDGEFLNQISGGKMKNISLYDTTIKSEIKKYVQKSDFLFFGGGPFMDIPATKMLEFAFEYAKKCGVRTGVLGCGYGPIKETKYKEMVKSLVSASDIVIFRDAISKQEYEKESGDDRCCSSIDPAVFCAAYAKQILSVSQPECADVVFNFRDVTLDSYDSVKATEYKNYFCSLIKKEADEKGEKVHLVPMHTYYVGGDDRKYLYELQKSCESNKIQLQSVPLSLFDTMKTYYNAKYCYGMRFHSVVLQTILNGRNIVLDYTDSKKGKTIGFLKQLELEDFYSKSYVSLTQGNYVDLVPADNVLFPKEKIDMYRNVYINELSKLL